MGRKKLILIIIAAALAIAAAGFAIKMEVLGNSLESQKAAERWRGYSDTRYAQISCFFPVGQELDDTALASFHEKIESSLSDAGLTEPETGSLWVEGYSSTCTLTVTGDHGASIASVCAVGGDFFQFHPLELMSGSYISGDDLMQDRVVLDKELAWKIFGGFDLAGKTVTIDGSEFIVAGVVERESDSASQTAYTDGAGMFMSYETAKKLGSVSGISCYELVVADPVEDFGKTIVTESMSSDGKFPVVENSKRFTVSAIFSVLGSFNERAMGTSGVLYPYWENAARLTENRMAVCLLCLIILAAMPVIFICIALIILLRRGMTAGKARLISEKDKIESRRYEKIRR